ncbi:erythromycin esterase family protein [[Actinomadura] parvosata]|uniref:erythromycin esterase family protein n=1 Tax=[Actinomadura] parvosata TaxID=1955412 RepID=UPI0018AD1ACB
MEARLSAAHPGDHVVDLRGGDRPEPVSAWLAAPGELRSFGAVARRLTARRTFTPTVLAEAFDGLAFLDRVGGSTPL